MLQSISLSFFIFCLLSQALTASFMVMAYSTGKIALPSNRILSFMKHVNVFLILYYYILCYLLFYPRITLDIVNGFPLRLVGIVCLYVVLCYILCFNKKYHII